MENLHFLRYTHTHRHTHTYGYYIIRIYYSNNYFTYLRSCMDSEGHMMKILLRSTMKSNPYLYHKVQMYLNWKYTWEIKRKKLNKIKVNFVCVTEQHYVSIFFTCLCSVRKPLLFDTQNPEISGFSTAHAYKYKTKWLAKMKRRRQKSDIAD